MGASRSKSSKPTVHLLALMTLSVYVGKLRGRKVAISEFRGHLSESEPQIALSDSTLTRCYCLVDIRELKLLAEFSHPNIVRFVRLSSSLICWILTGSAARHLHSRGHFANPLHARERALREWRPVRLYCELKHRPRMHGADSTVAQCSGPDA